MDSKKSELEKSINEEMKEKTEKNNCTNDSIQNDFTFKPQKIDTINTKANYATFVDKTNIVNKFLEQKSEKKINLKKNEMIKKNILKINVKSNNEMIGKEKNRIFIQNRAINHLNEAANQNIINNSLKVNLKNSTPGTLSPKTSGNNIKTLPNDRKITIEDSKRFQSPLIKNNENISLLTK